MTLHKFPTNGMTELPAGSMVGDTLLLTALRADAKGAIGFPAVAGALMASGTVFHAEAVPFFTNLSLLAQSALKLGDTLELQRGRLEKQAVYLDLTAEEGGVVGTLKPGATPIVNRMPARVAGINPRWPVGSWQAGEPVREGLALEGKALLRLDVTKAGAFYLGNLLLADQPDLYLAFASAWDERGEVKVEVTNPTDKPLTATILTPEAIKGVPALKTKVTVAAGETRVISFNLPTGGTGSASVRSDDVDESGRHGPEADAVPPGLWAGI